MDPRSDLTARLLATLFIGALVLAAFWIVRPFIAATVWAITVVVVTWPIMLRCQRALWGSRAAAIAAMVILVSLLFVLPLTVAVVTVLANVDEITALVGSLAGSKLPATPHWVMTLPFIGAKIDGTWTDVAAWGVEGAWTRFMPYAGGLTAWVVGRAGSIGYQLIQFLLTLLLAGFIYAHGEKYAAAALRLGHKLAGSEGEALARLAAQSVRSIALGVGLTAAIQSVLGGAGLALAGVPFAGVLTVALFLLCITQIGMLVLLIPAVLWVYWSGHAVTGTFLLVWAVGSSLLDNVLRPMLVRNANLPALMVFVGVVGGLLAFGLLGIFVGPVVLAVAHTLLTTWLHGRSNEPACR